MAHSQITFIAWNGPSWTIIIFIFWDVLRPPPPTSSHKFFLHYSTLIKKHLLMDILYPGWLKILPALVNDDPNIRYAAFLFMHDRNKRETKFSFCIFLSLKYITSAGVAENDNSKKKIALL